MKKIFFLIFGIIFLISIVSAAWTDGLNTSLSQYYKFNGDFVDSFSGKDGTNYGITFATGKNNQGAFSSGGPNFVNITTAAHAYSFWFKTNAAGLRRLLIGEQNEKV
jgi:hypothetical protein